VDRVLIANRGEIARRVIRAARELGFRTVAVYSTADTNAVYVREADQAVCIGEAPPALSYLNIPALIQAACRTGADTVHPGYGFLAENAQFARACEDSGLTFVGPSSRVIALMGDKAEAKRLMRGAGIACIPGYDGKDQSSATLVEHAARIGFPVMIKAVAGGGGRGMRIVRSADRFVELLRSAQYEAKSAFADASVILERAIERARHIEIQILVDRHGNAIHLGERECSVQRRHQKIIEEAPSPIVSTALRKRMGATAVAAAKAVGYEGAGTLEFLLDDDGDFYFMEMNTRLQVEHPVTEAVTGLDLVQLQFKVASGEPLPVVQEEVRFSGHSIEVRLCAEDPAQNLMPQSGTIALWRIPERGPGRLRVEHALESGAEVPVYYDSMVAKIVSHAPTREEARRKLIRGLEKVVALGVTTNQAFLARCLAHPVFARGEATTAFVDEHEPELRSVDAQIDALAMALAALLLLQPLTGLDAGRTRQMLGRLAPVTLLLGMGDATHRMTITPESHNRWWVEGSGHRNNIDVISVDAHHVRFARDGISESAAYVRDGPHLLLSLRGHSYSVHDMTHVSSAKQGLSRNGDGNLRATMTGRVVEVLIEVGDRVAAGQSLFALEAMKMECVQTSPVAGMVKAVHVSAGDQVTAAWLLAEIEIESAPD
jgi:geranyl-CoA carboxylase alpha subunit